jgi:hypothetical protein
VAANSQSDIGNLRRAAQAYPTSDLAHYKLANALLGAGQKDPALAEYRQAYILSQSEQMSANCRKVLTFYRVALPAVGNEPLQARLARAKLPLATSGSLEEFMSMASRSGDSHQGRMDSHPEGVVSFKQCPDSSGPLADPWHKWNEDFRLAFEARLRKRLAALGIPAIYGRTKLIFSIDKNRHLRGRILETTLPPLLWACMLEATKALDGSNELDFPRGSQIDGFNFTIGWTFIDPPLAVQERVAALMRFNRLTGAIAPGQGLNATALGLNSNQTAAQLNNVNGKLLSGQGLQGQAQGLGGGQVDGKLLPKVDAEVSGQLMPKPKLEELKASPGKL